jgi:hypothetical protein
MLIIRNNLKGILVEIEGEMVYPAEIFVSSINLKIIS